MNRQNPNPPTKSNTDSNYSNHYSNSDDDDNDSNDGDSTTPAANKFANDGSFLEMFKKMQQQQQQNSNNSTPNTNLDLNKEDSRRPSNSNSSNANDSWSIDHFKVKEPPSSSKRKPKVLKVGVIKKSRAEEDSNEVDSSNDSAWSRYMREVKNYKEKYGDDGDKNRPLVK